MLQIPQLRCCTSSPLSRIKAALSLYALSPKAPALYTTPSKHTWSGSSPPTAGSQNYVVAPDNTDPPSARQISAGLILKPFFLSRPAIPKHPFLMRPSPPPPTCQPYARPQHIHPKRQAPYALARSAEEVEYLFSEERQQEMSQQEVAQLQESPPQPLSPHPAGPPQERGQCAAKNKHGNITRPCEVRQSRPMDNP